MRALVTGGAGFIGSHLVTRLLEHGTRVEILDDLSTGRLENLAGCLDRPELACHLGSITDPDLVDRLMARADVVIHLAAAVGVGMVAARPVDTIVTNVLGTEVVLAAAARHGRRVLLASSSEVYGKSSQVPFAEDDDLVLGATRSPRWAYACSKALDEWLALAYHRERALPVVIVRLFNTAGARQRGRYGMVLPRLATQAVRGDPLTVYGDGEQTRCFAHVRDVVTVLLGLLATPAAIGEVFNVGTDHEITINALATLVRVAAGSAAPIVHVPLEIATAPGFEDMRRRVPDLRKLTRALGALPPMASLDEIVAEVVADRRARLQR